MVTRKNRLQNNIINKNDTELSKEYWKVDQQNGMLRIKWKVLKERHAYNMKKRQ